MPGQATELENKFLTILNNIRKNLEVVGLASSLKTYSCYGKIDNALFSDMEKLLRKVTPNTRDKILTDAELLDRINDLLGIDNLQKIASIGWFSEQNESAYLEILKIYKKYEKSPLIEAIAKDAIARLSENLSAHQEKDIQKLFDLKSPNFTESELEGKFQPDRRPVRVLVRIVRVENDEVGLVLPGWWYPEQEIIIDKSGFPENLHHSLLSGKRFFARVNIGAEKQSELYFIDCEYKP